MYSSAAGGGVYAAACAFGPPTCSSAHAADWPIRATQNSNTFGVVCTRTLLAVPAAGVVCSHTPLAEIKRRNYPPMGGALHSRAPRAGQ